MASGGIGQIKRVAGAAKVVGVPAKVARVGPAQAKGPDVSLEWHRLLSDDCQGHAGAFQQDLLPICEAGPAAMNIEA